MGKKNVYAVRKGFNTGIFQTWEECEKQVKGFKGAEFKGFSGIQDARQYLNSKVDGKKEREKLQCQISKDAVQIYVDGSFNLDKKIAAYGLVIVKKDKAFLKDFSAYPYVDVTDSHNVGAELIGAKRAVELSLANDFKKLVIHYDYMGIEKFATGAWRAKTPQTLEYQMFMQRYMQLVDISFVKIKSHSGNKFNDMADRLARFATHL